MSFNLHRAAALEVTVEGDFTGWLEYDLYSDDFDGPGGWSHLASGASNPERLTYTVKGLPAAPTAICVDFCEGNPDGFWYEDAETFENATLVELRRGETTKITIQLQD